MKLTLGLTLNEANVEQSTPIIQVTYVVDEHGNQVTDDHGNLVIV